MKRIVLLFTAVMALSLGANSQNIRVDNVAKQVKGKEMKTVVVFFSATGVTAEVANNLADFLEADRAEIRPEQPYTKEDLDWRNKQSRSSVEMNDKRSRPAMKKMDVNVADYDVIFVGFPIWWYTCPTIINTFMESTDFSGKIVIPFATSGGSDIDKACEDLQSAYPDVKWKRGRLLNHVGIEEIANWITELVETY